MSILLVMHTFAKKKKIKQNKRLSYRYSGILFGVVGIQILLQLQRAELHLLKETIGHDL